MIAVKANLPSRSEMVRGRIILCMVYLATCNVRLQKQQNLSVLPEGPQTRKLCTTAGLWLRGFIFEKLDYCAAQKGTGKWCIVGGSNDRFVWEANDALDLRSRLEIEDGKMLTLVLDKQPDRCSRLLRVDRGRGTNHGGISGLTA